MARPLKITVRKRHIEKGLRNNPESCPIALALREELITNYVSVKQEMFVVNNIAYDMTEQMKRFVARFDGGNKVRPWTFYLQRPER